jgi:hypothetical protein
VAGTCFEFVQDEEGLGVDVHIKPAAEPAVLAFQEGHVLNERLELAGPFHRE